MPFPVRASGFVVTFLFAGPALAQQGPTPIFTKISQATIRDGVVPTGYVKACGSRFVCYTGIPLNCAPNTRPYQSIPDHQCFCLRDNCPQ